MIAVQSSSSVQHQPSTHHTLHRMQWTFFFVPAMLESKHSHRPSDSGRPEVGIAVITIPAATRCFNFSEKPRHPQQPELKLQQGLKHPGVTGVLGLCLGTMLAAALALLAGYCAWSGRVPPKTVEPQPEGAGSVTCTCAFHNHEL